MEATVEKNKSRITILLLISILVAFAFWAGANLFDTYKYAVAGAIFEIAWLPMIVVAFGAPLVSLYFWAKERFKISSVFLYLFLLSALSVYIIVSHD